MTRHLLISLVLGIMVSTALGQGRRATKKKEEVPVKIPGVPELRPIELRKRVKWWNIWIYKNKMPISEINQYVVYLKKLQQDALKRKEHEKSLYNPRRVWLEYFEALHASYQKRIDVLGLIVKAKVQYIRVKDSARADNVKLRESTEEQLKQLCKDFRKAVLSTPRRPK